jgi:hypothetical protein
VGEVGEGRGGAHDTSSMCVEQGDMIEADISDATVVWCANLCMSLEFDRILALKLAQQPNLRAVASLKDWPVYMCRTISLASPIYIHTYMYDFAYIYIDR